MLSMQICLPIPLVLLALLCIPAPRYIAAFRFVRNDHLSLLCIN